jgi:hypothetical protein
MDSGENKSSNLLISSQSIFGSRLIYRLIYEQYGFQDFPYLERYLF